MNIPSVFEQTIRPGDKGYVSYLTQVLKRYWGQLAKVVNNGIEMYNISDTVSNIPKGTIVSANVKGYWWQGDLTGSTIINHDLGYAPIGFIIVRQTTGVVPYFVSSTKTTITVTCAGSAPGTILFII